MPKWLFAFVQFRQRLWLTVAAYSVLGLLAALLAAAFGRYVPSDFPLKLGSDSVDDILSILATSMLAVATFSLTTLVTAYTSVIGNVAPHAAKLLVSDRSIRSALATFVGAFIYAIVGIVALHTGYYGAQGRVILFFITLAVLMLVVLAMLRWIGQLSSLAQTDQVIDRVAAATAEALRSRAAAQGWRSQQPEPSAGGVAVFSEEVGYVRNIDLEGLEAIAAEQRARIHVSAAPGAFVHRAQPLFRVEGPQALGTDLVGRLRSKVTLGDRRTFEQDPRFGLVVLGEIAGRALSPGVNDPGTAKDVVSGVTRLLHDWVQASAGEAEPGALTGVHIPALPALDLLEDAFGPVVRDGARQLSLQLELQAALLALASAGDGRLAEAARTFSQLALERTLPELAHEADRTRLTQAAAAAQAQPL